VTNRGSRWTGRLTACGQPIDHSNKFRNRTLRAFRKQVMSVVPMMSAQPQKRRLAAGYDGRTLVPRSHCCGCARPDGRSQVLSTRSRCQLLPLWIRQLVHHCAQVKGSQLLPRWKLPEALQPLPHIACPRSDAPSSGCLTVACGESRQRFCSSVSCIIKRRDAENLTHLTHFVGLRRAVGALA
jgi:hypothetical protein